MADTNGASAGHASVHDRVAAAIGEHKAGALEEAERDYRGILADCPDEPNATHFLGVLRFQAGAKEEGIALVRASLETDPNNVHAWNSLGNLELETGAVEAAEQAYLRATSLDGRLAAAWYNLSRVSIRLRNFEQARRALRKVTTHSRGFGSALQSLAQLYYASGRTDEARDIYEQWAAEAPEDPTPRHMLAATAGRGVPDRADDRYIKGTFDGFAESFDSQLAKLEYCAPQLVAARVMQHPLYRSGRASLLDAGCGTGWCGPLLRPTAKRLVGVDLSPNMLEQAKGRGVYDELHEAELTAFIAAHPGSFDIIVSADVLCYFGRLEELARATCAALRPAGLFAFSVEALDAEGGEADFHLGTHGRYAHRQAYVEQVMADAGFEPPSIDAAVLRLELGTPVQGHIVAGRAADPQAPAGAIAVSPLR